MARRYRSIARVEKTHGRQGEIVAVDIDGLGSYLRPGMWVWAVPPRLKGPRSFVVSRVKGNGRGQLVSLVGVGSIAEASRLVGRTLLAAVDELPDDFELHADVCLHLSMTVCTLANRRCYVREYRGSVLVKMR